MPLFDFKCPKCNKKFDQLVKIDEKVKCPRCKVVANKQFSVFGFKSSGQDSSPSACGSCTSSNCGTCK